MTFTTFGVLRHLVLVAAVLLLLPTGQASSQTGRPEGLYYKSWAIVIGIDDYLLAPKLSGSLADAKATAEALRKMGFEEIIEIYNKDASFRGLNVVFNDFLPRKIGRQDRLVIFFAGHAGMTKDVNGHEMGYLVPWDAQIGNVPKSFTTDQLKDFSRRVMAKHVVYILDAPIQGWEVTPPQQLSLEGRLAPEEETDKRAVQVISAARSGESLTKTEGVGLFTKVLIAGLTGAADSNKNGWLMATELAAYVTEKVQAASGGAQHPLYARLDGDGDAIFIEGKKTAYGGGAEPKTDAERTAVAKAEYEKAVSLLQQQRSTKEALEHLDRAIELVPAYGDAYVLKSYIYLDIAPNLDKALATAQDAVKFASTNADTYFTLGMVYQRQSEFPKAEQAYLQALSVNPDYSEVHLALGDMYAEEMKDRKKALSAYRRYLETGGTQQRVKAYVEENSRAEDGTKP